MNSMIYEERVLDKPIRKIKKDAANEMAEIFDGPLRQLDIVVAIQYYGVAELLDHIGVSEIKRYLASR
ncbi:hypothetical protein [Parapedobacter sp.]